MTNIIEINERINDYKREMSYITQRDQLLQIIGLTLVDDSTIEQILRVWLIKELKIINGLIELNKKENENPKKAILFSLSLSNTLLFFFLCIYSIYI